MSFDTIGNYLDMADNSKRKKIGIFLGGKTNRYSVSSYIRILSPLNELSSYYSIRIIDEDSFKQFFKDLDNDNVFLDIIIFQRENFGNLKLDLEFITSLFEKIKRNNIRIIYDLDDNLLSIDKNHLDYEEYSKLYETFKFMVTDSDIVTVSTQYLKTQLIKYNENVEIIPNTLMRLWDFNPKSKIKNLNSKKQIKIGYFGGLTHGDDMQLINDAINQVKNHFKDKEIIFEIVGVCKQNHEWINRIDLPHNYGDKPTVKNKLKNVAAYFLNKLNILRVNLPYCGFIKFMKNEIEWDIGLAPLKDTNINKSKSNLKYLEYTALNIPGIYSNVGPYHEIAHKKTGITVNNNNEWGNAIINLIEDNKLYENLLKNAYGDVGNNYLVENASSIWDDIL